MCGHRTVQPDYQVYQSRVLSYWGLKPTLAKWNTKGNWGAQGIVRRAREPAEGLMLETVAQITNHGMPTWYPLPPLVHRTLPLVPLHLRPRFCPLTLCQNSEVFRTLQNSNSILWIQNSKYSGPLPVLITPSPPHSLLDQRPGWWMDWPSPADRLMLWAQKANSNATLLGGAISPWHYNVRIPKP